MASKYKMNRTNGFWCEEYRCLAECKSLIRLARTFLDDSKISTCALNFARMSSELVIALTIDVVLKMNMSMVDFKKPS